MAKSFYTKDFSKKAFFEAVASIVAGEEVEDEVLTQVGAAADYELERIEASKAKKADTAKEKVPVEETEYGLDIIATIVPLVTTEPQTTAQIIALSKAKGLKNIKGNDYANPWVNNVFSALAKQGVLVREVLPVDVTKTDSDGNEYVARDARVTYRKA